MQQAILILICCSILIYISVYDVFYRKIPNHAVSLLAGACGLSAIADDGVGVLQAFAGAGSIAMFMIVLNLAVRTFGGGDIKLMSAGALSLGVEGSWKAFSAGVLAAGVWCLFLLFRRKSVKGTELPMGIFFSIGMFLAWLQAWIFV